ncbi:MAG: putative toxin-antitoxin system toxin component, PIN family [Candidatus Aenigmatarchaeota archaeon]
MTINLPVKVVIDTNLIIAGRYNPKSASNKIIDLCIEQKLIAIYSEKTRNENIHILQKVRPSAEYMQKIGIFFSKAFYIPDPHTRINICSDHSDNKYFETAVDGGAQFIISNDRHLLEHNGYYGIQVLRPREFLNKMLD